MNLAQSMTHDSTGCGITFMVGELMESRRHSLQRGPKLRADYSLRLWQAIVAAPEPLTKREWMRAAGIVKATKRMQTLAANSILNMTKCGWVRCSDGRYSQA